MKISAVILGAALITSSEAWKIRFRGKDSNGQDATFLIESRRLGRKCHKVEAQYTDIVVNEFRWDPTSKWMTDGSLFYTYPNNDCLDIKKDGKIKWRGDKKTGWIPVSKPQTVGSYRVFSG
jgi:hypothetical protein